ncbi:MAG: Aspartyl/glutamyl-tRNA(Asn/Gln) amidotransferase subunit B [Chlamydiia bacterium]|nr:Aspartyl/glutamyl-tRNA(Asn/Gln) amidotransferase subunit B [Chlamydiia bacterium]MCH9618225.1 Aspartyl/glutamyl-tRNA(Asn/Gln) amidotransferase subunit B [Chlamydiia bacterium]MCH9624052.1 Aspartyl/glutamyl-tRNA(Asn/Gln) amidotransferase subunit B [Chlamydiia bacterium]
MSNDYDEFEAVIGLEIHCQMNTKTKFFGRETNSSLAEPNANIGFVDTGQPGALPVINKEAVKKAIAFGLAVDAQINETSTFDRKSYFYPDCPFNYQITQFYHPIITGGSITCDVDGILKTFSIEHTHMENDAGKLVHFPDFTGVDYNRSGAPLIEIVSDPCMHTPREAGAYARAIYSILKYIRTSDCNMQEGHLRMDANISVRLKGETELRPKAEVKNMNSFVNMEMAIESEIRRQIAFYRANPDKRIKTGTYRFDLEKKKTILMRSKESADDYRYFPEPDLPPLVLEQAFINDVKDNLPELPVAKRKRFVEKIGLSEYFADLLIDDISLCDFFEAGEKHCTNPKAYCNWVAVEFGARANAQNKHVKDLEISPKNIASLVNMIEKGTITGKMAKEIADIMIASPEKTPMSIAEGDSRFKPMDNTAALEAIIDTIISENPDSIQDFKNGKDKAFQFLVGKVMKQTKGTAPPPLVKEMILKRL